VLLVAATFGGLDESSWFLVHIAVFVAAVIQAATGLGFGLFAGPVLMLAMDDVSAVQASILLSLMIALCLSPPLYKKADRPMLNHLLIGSVAGMPIGISIYLHADLGTLKLLAGGVVLAMALSVFLAARHVGPVGRRRRSKLIDIAVGGTSGIMTACLAMPGPAPGALMTGCGYDKTVTRATILTFFVPAYVLALLLQVSVATVALDTWATTATLAPATIVGLFCGKALASRITERVFRLCILFLLLSTAAALLVSGIGSWMS
jgi:uncharacterized membrane protein YfcA